MNIEKLLRKLDKNSIQNKKQLLAVHAPYKLKTCESIGTVNSIGQQNQRSFVISDNQTPHHRNTAAQGLSANSKLDQQLSQIEIMKNLYESRQIKNRLKTKSIQRNSASGQKSLQKHLLKPSNTPSFNKAAKIKPIQKQNDSACKNLYTENILQNSQMSNLPLSNPKGGNKKIVYQLPDSSLHIQDHEQLPYEEQPYYNQQSLSQIGNVSQDHLHEISPLQLKKPVPDTCQQIWQKDSQSLTNVNPYCSARSKNEANQNIINNCNCNCVSKDQIAFLIEGFEAKFEKFAIRLSELEQQNRKLRLDQQKMKAQSQRQQTSLKQQVNQKDKVLLQLKKQQQQKQQLQILLKDVLYKRQRQRLQSSKQNTYRENEKSERKLVNYSFAQSQSTCDLKPPRNSVGSQNRQSQSKMKVQNLLNKLQIKVDRV